MKKLEKMHELGTALTKQEQSMIVAGDTCWTTGSLSYGGCTLVSYQCVGSEYPYSNGENDFYNKTVTTCSSGISEVSYSGGRYW